MKTNVIMINYTRSQIRANRLKWIDFLLVKGRKKAKLQLDTGEGARCCLGHGCYALGLKREQLSDGTYAYQGSTDVAPVSFQKLVGLWDDTGSTAHNTHIDFFGNNILYNDLASINDDTNASPKKIGEYLLSVIDGGDNTPFKPLSDYPE